MERCHNCKAELLYGKTEFCDHCGARLSSREDSENEQEKIEVEPVESPERPSGPPKFKKVTDSDLELESDAEILNHMSDSQPLPTSSAMADTGSSARDKGSKRLNAEEVKNVEKNLYGSAKYLNDKDKETLIKSVAKVAPASASPENQLQRETAFTAADDTDLPRPAISKRGRGLAHFSGRFIRILGEMEIRDQDELLIRDRVYLLRRKMVIPNSVIGGGLGLVALLLLVIGLQFTGSGSGSGQLVGLVLDSNNQPYVYGATVRFPDLDRSVTANGQGFFQVDGIPVGSHKLEYMVNGQVVAVDFATVTAGEMTTLTFSPTTPETGVYSERPQPMPQVYAQVEPTNPAPITRNNQQATFTPARPADENQNRGQASLALQANVDNAKLEVNGNVVGAGNLIFSRLKPGEARYTVSAPGYETATGILRLKANEVTTLDVVLNPTTTAATTPQHVSPQTSLTPAQTELSNGNYRDAIQQFSQVIEADPGNADAFVGRAEAHLGLGDKNSAYQDFVQAAEINRVAGNPREAISLFNDAIKANAKDPNAYLGRAESYLARNEEIAAIADYETVVRLDKRNFRAYMGLGEARYGQGNYKLAIKNFKYAQDLDARNPDVYAGLMLAYLGDDDLKSVRKTYEKFKEVATQDQMSRLTADSRYSAVFRVLAEE